MSILYVIRHSETDYNNKGIYIGRKDIKINENGKNQAEFLGKKFQKENPDLIITSSLSRAKETAEIINKYTKKDIIVDNRFVEADIGIYEGLTSSEFWEIIENKYYGDIYKFYNNNFLGGENSREIEKRVSQGLKDIKKNYQNKKIILITHGFVIRIVNKYFNPDISFTKFFNFLIKNGEIKKFNF